MAITFLGLQLGNWMKHREVKQQTKSHTVEDERLDGTGLVLDAPFKEESI